MTCEKAGSNGKGGGTPPRRSRAGLRPGHLVTGLCALALSACAAGGAMNPFSSDGCSLFPDRALIGEADWSRCCAAHDLAYWRGGTADERLQADSALKACVVQVTGNEALGALMFEGVRAGGGPYFFTSYRWGYGWPYGRAYAPLTPAEEAQASALAPKHLATRPKAP